MLNERVLNSVKRARVMIISVKRARSILAQVVVGHWGNAPIVIYHVLFIL